MSTPLLDTAGLGDRTSGVRALHGLIDSMVEAESLDGDYDGLLIEVDRAIRRLESFKLRVVAAADAARVADRTGLAGTSSWLARRTHADPAQSAADVRLATALDSSRPCSEALSAGELSTEHAKVIVKATEQLPEGLDEASVAQVEQRLVEQATHLSPEQLRRAARRALAAVEDDRAAVDAHEDQLLRSEEQAALAKARLTWHDNEDGTVSGYFTVPAAAAAILIRMVQSMTSPRRARLGATAAQAGTPVERRTWVHQNGLAFVELLEHLPTDHLHGKVAATVVATVELATLQAALGAAGLDSGERISAGDLRRLACSASILPAVMNGPSLPLDLGRSSRLFSEAQRLALATRHSTCAADGCERPFAWCELHHQHPWSHGGRTDLKDAIPVCGFHHRRIHDPSYIHRFGPDGITFHRRT
ncbi:MAG: DUF222 domain-containing protein [Nocardioidaceae bacterium]|nr:DUF222 domain-containing protein [Nocardioidaceae bacterium]